MKSVLISIQPKWVEKIASGKKTIEVRKTRPKIETPFKCYIYQTKSKDNSIYKQYKVNDIRSGKVIGEFVCDRIDNYECELWNDEAYELIRQFNYDEYGEIEYEHGAENNENCEILNKACLTWQDIRKYLGQGLNNCYAWHISNLKIYDKPKELSEFYQPCPQYYSSYEEGICAEMCVWYDMGICKNFSLPLTRPPQSYMFVESLGE